jgi:ribosome biogenesis GTPase
LPDHVLPDPAVPALVRLGAGPALLPKLLALAARPPAVPGRVGRVDRGRVLILTPAGACTVPEPAGDPLVTGDWVAVTGAVDAAGSPDTGPVVTAVLPRRGALVRAASVRRPEPQVLAAGVDVVLIAAALPARQVPARLERLLALAWEAGATPAVIATKADLLTAEQVADRLSDIRAVVVGAPVHAVSAPTGAGLDDVRGLLGPGRTAALLGPSGTGKSTLLNALLGDLPEQPTACVGEVRPDGKGRHTTTARELRVLPGGGAVIDTPGLRGVALWESDDGLDRVFADVADLAVDCRFRDCQHRAEPGCAVLAAVAAGVLDPHRVRRHHKLTRELAHTARRFDAQLRAEENRRWKTIAKEQRARGHR